ncbi:hypothetical protein EVA_00269 [gut metagenome]|uniref:Uncharacterized protein n=1 Tax=gut metagenome TaxID=749906 RepID=J9H938_9ZZZZ
MSFSSYSIKDSLAKDRHSNPFLQADWRRIPPMPAKRLFPPHSPAEVPSTQLSQVRHNNVIRIG